MNQDSRKPTLRERFNISRLAIQHFRFTILFWIAITIAGLLAFSSLKYALFPEITFPVIVVNAQAPFETVLETQTQLTIPIEQPLKSISGFRDVASTSYPGRAIVNVFFDVGTSLVKSSERVEKALDKLSLPQGTTYEVIAVNLNETGVISYAVVSDHKSLEDLTAIANQKILPKLADLPGVLKANLLGDGSSIDPQDKEENSSPLTQKYPTLVRFNGQEGLAIQVIKESRANTLDVVSQVEKTIGELQPLLPDVTLTLAETQAEYIREATQATIDSLILAIILAVLVIFPFLESFRATFITALAIPISLLATCIIMAIFGFNLETITLLALALVIGIVVDDGIVDVENIARHIDQGETPKQAALKGTEEIGLAVTASTLTIAAVFIPVAFMGGGVGKFFKPFGLTVSAAVLFSLLVARTLSPVLASRWLKPRKQRKQNQNQREFPLISSYQNLLDWSLHHRRIVMVIALISFIIGVALIPLIPKGFIPNLNRGEFNIVYTSPLPKRLLTLDSPQPPTVTPPSGQTGAFDWISQLANSPQTFLLRKTIRVGKEFETILQDIPEIESYYTVAGVQGEPTKGKIYVNLKHDRQLTTDEVKTLVREKLPKLKRVTFSVEDIPFIQTEAEKPLQIAIKGNNLITLKDFAQTLKTRVQDFPRLKDVALSNQDDEGENTYKLERLGGQPVIYLSANLASSKVGLEDAAKEIERAAKPILPPDITLQRWGSSAQSNDVLMTFGRTLALSIILMLVVLIVSFGRILEPIVIILSLPLSIVGAMLGLLITQSDFGVISLIGLIFLVGLLDKNAVLLLDYINQLRQAGKSREEAILETGAVRLRPIMMTTASTILGMLPLALGWGAGAELRQPMAVAIIGGLITSSLLSLIVVPVLYTLLEDGWIKMFKKH
ncbi:acriflavin resistance protein [Gloeothece citriformis PCC 7424]|uniref:Acriflavin resistance protein n=1 Tax=Gloeothece citriformis (strain PCC 7424) TaxID=65393 RepID=B7KE72_GLOC7|nr:efflux RND transporter permease subunit [Gloeothece citriformis]ACK71770.1 acriflavin resistance protein [Gloeothece citriformis PCC 7424]